ncbi:MAG: zinc ribbon domain-containing protein [Wenzhouxiangellaceae bacterium]
MPIYEYQCRECSHRLEKLQKLSDAPLTTCPECSRESLTKLVSAAGFRLKGGGWYETDFKKDGKRNLAGDDSSSKSEGGGSSDSGAKEAGKKEAGKADAGTSDAGKKEPAKASGKSADNSGTSGKSSSSSAA